MYLLRGIRNTKEDHESIKEGRVPENWNNQANKISQKDVDARFTKKHNKSYFGYKDHIKADAVSNLIDDYMVSPAADLHDSQALNKLLTKKDRGQDKMLIVRIPEKPVPNGYSKQE